MSSTDTPTQQKKKGQQRAVWAGFDSFSLISACREGLYELPQAGKEQRAQTQTAIEEALARLEQHERIGLGVAFTGTPPQVGVGS